jgi:hypothetical protein
MSTVRLVASAVKEMGVATITQLCARFPDIPRKKIHNALGNAQDAGYLRIKARGCAKANRDSVWEPGEKVARLKESKPAPLPVSSVFALGTASEWVGTWPPLQSGRKVAPLGSWSAE